MKRVALALVALAAIATVALLALYGGGEPQRLARDGAGAADAEGRLADDLTGTSASDARAAIDAADAAATTLDTNATPTSLDGTNATSHAPTAHIRGVLLQHDHTPVDTARLVLRGYVDEGRAAQFGRPSNWQDIETTTAADGSFDIAFNAHPAVRYTFEAFAKRAPKIALWWPSLHADVDLDLGTIVLPLGAELELRIVKPDGTPARGIWSLWLHDEWLTPLRGEARLSQGPIRVDGNTPHVIESLAAGAVELSVTSVVGASRFRRVVNVAPGESASVEFVHEGPDVDRRLLVRPTGPLIRRFEWPALAAFNLYGADGTLAADGTRTQVDRLTLAWSDLEPGAYTLSVDDPRFAPLVGVEVRAGESTTVELTGSVAVTFTLTNAAGVPVENARFQLQPFDKELANLNQIPVMEPTVAPAAGTYTFVSVPDPQVWTIEAPGYAPKEIAIEAGFEARSEQRLDVVLERAVEIQGRVLDALGRPVARCSVKARVVRDEPPPESDDDAYFFWTMDAGRHEWVSVWTDGEGRFATGHLTGASFDVHTANDPRICAFAMDVAAGRDDVELVLAPHGRLVGRIEPNFPGRDGVTVQVSDVVAKQHLPARIRPFLTDRVRATTSPDGTFTIEDLPIGVHELRVGVPVAPWQAFEDRGARVDGIIEPLEFTIANGETTTLVVDASALGAQSAHIRIVETNRVGSRLQVAGLRFDDEHATWIEAASGLVDGDDVALLAPLPPGRWRFAVRMVEPTWTHWLPGEYVVRAHDTLTLDFSVELVHGRVVLEDAAGRNLGRRQLNFERIGLSYPVTSNADGVLELLLPPGNYSLAERVARDATTGRPALVEPVELVWTSAGPAKPVLVLPSSE